MEEYKYFFPVNGKEESGLTFCQFLLVFQFMQSWPHIFPLTRDRIWSKPFNN